MTRWLASVQSLEEAQSLSTCLPDIVDMKQPSQGALGALPVVTVKSIVSWLNGATLTSATIGDLPMQAEVIAPALVEMAASGVDYVKIGLFNDAGLETCIEQLEPHVRAMSVPVIAVMFADQTDNLELVTLLKKSGFTGAMVDTASKDGRGLLDHWTKSTIKRFIERAKSLGLLCGLAGALKVEDIQLLKTLDADYLGFRSALCSHRERTTRLQPELVLLVKEALAEELSQAV